MSRSKYTPGGFRPGQTTIFPEVVQWHPKGGAVAVQRPPGEAERRKWKAEQFELIQPSLYEDQTLSKNRTVWASWVPYPWSGTAQAVVVPSQLRARHRPLLLFPIHNNGGKG